MNKLSKRQKSSPTDKVPGGKGQFSKPEDVDAKELAMGIEIEYEHTPNTDIAQDIALDHLTEISDYYTRLEKMEEEAKEEGTFIEDKSETKTATIRGESVRECPFGLPIPEACDHVGNSIHRMAPGENNDGIKKANKLVYAYHKDCKSCPYACKVLEENKKVDCNFGDTAAGKKTPSFTGSPLYPQTFSGIGLDGLYGYPLGFYSDNNESRNLFFGLFSFLGSMAVEELIKLADQYDSCGEKEKAEILDNLLNKMKTIKEEYKDTFEKIQKYLEEYRKEYAENRSDTGLLYELADSWFGPRQINR